MNQHKPNKSIKKQYNISVYICRESEYTSHAFCMDDFPNGVYLPIGDISIDPTLITFTQLRPLIEYNTSSRMNKRSMIFQEVLYIMNKISNIYERPKHEKLLYAFGYVDIADESNKLMMIERNQEDTIIFDLLSTNINNILIVPYSQIDPVSYNIHKIESSENDII